MSTTTSRRRGSTPSLPSGARGIRLLLAQLDQDQADLERARELLQHGRDLVDVEPREAFELVHRAALRGAGVIVARANRDRRRKLPLNVWTALEKIGGQDAQRAEDLAPLVLERARLDRDSTAVPDPVLLQRHLEQTAQHLDSISEGLLASLPDHVTALAG